MINIGIDKYLDKNSVRFFMPGHKGTLSKYDVTELDGTDNLHFPNGIIMNAEKEVSNIIGSKRTFFSVNGTTAGIHAAIMCVCRRGDKIIVDRGCHISVINALIMYDITPVFVYPRLSAKFGVSCGINPKDLSDLLSEDIKAVLITSPTYYGVCSDIAAISDLVHKKGIPLIVDEAHGAHFSFCSKLPKSAVSLGADIVIQSNHKTLTCLTQGAMVHLCGNLINSNEMQKCMNMVLSTSPSYLLMSSIEESVLQMADIGQIRLKKLIQKCDEVRDRLNRTKRYVCMDNSDEYFDYDKTRLVISTFENTKSLCQGMHREFSVEVETEDGKNIICIPTINNTDKDFDALFNALTSLMAEDQRESYISCLPKTKLVLSPHKAYYSDKENACPNNSIGKIAAQSVYKSPPCIPILCPGELITKEIANFLTEDVDIVLNKDNNCHII